MEASERDETRDAGSRVKEARSGEEAPDSELRSPDAQDSEAYRAKQKNAAKPRGWKSLEDRKQPPRKPDGAGVLGVASFLCGAAVMVLEMAGSRVIAPYMGTSLIVWTSLIGIIMASLSAGYWLGGVAADLRPERKLLARIILLSALFTALMALVANPLLSFLSSAFDSLYVSSVLAALFLFTIPGLLLGMVSPFIVRLAMKDVGTSGTIVGRFSALSSAGSIFGTFLGGFVLISFFSSGTILLLVAATLAFTALLIYRTVWKKAALLVVVLLAGSVATEVWGMPWRLVGEHIETPYNHIWIVESQRASDRRVRIMMTDPEGAQSVMYTNNPTELVSDYTKFYDLAFHYNPGAKKVLMLGGGGYCVPRHVMEEHPDIVMDVVEIDPGVTSAARRYFHLPKNLTGLSVHHEDARIFLNRAAADPQRRETYDAVFADVFGASYSIPFHLATVEAARAMYDMLTPGGVLISNVISSLEGPRSLVFQGIYASLSSVFPRLLIFPATRAEPEFRTSRQNIMIVAFRSPEDLPVVSPWDPRTSELLAHRWTRPWSPSVPPFTDAFAPVERYSLMQ
ncbi:MAG: fused MFS/spermidine synthase [Synergistaceae bacterium]|jgi:spermidine synthase|nr:fused MFS/spermidine synthase [Synergistaceae bacterium]